MSLYFLLIVPFILIVAGRKSDYSEKSEIMNAYIHRSNMKVLENIEWSIRQDELMTWNIRTFSQMKPYGMTLRENFDAHDDKLGALKTAPNTQIQGRLKENTYKSLRNGKKNRIRRRQKRRERAKNRNSLMLKDYILKYSFC